MSVKTVKMCDLPISLSVEVFARINSGKISIHESDSEYPIIITDVEPKDLAYPEGWYYAKGTFRNKHQSTTGAYSEALMLKSNGEYWQDTAIYCTLNM